MQKIYVTKKQWGANATDGITYWTDLDKMAEHVFDAEACGATVQVYRCVPVSHEVYNVSVKIDIGGDLE